ncbi:amidohydrolase family protein, partial [bacterium]|nr:amidohydrolase family protein [bacterium]
THATTDMRWAEDRVGAARLEGAYAWRSLLETGAHLAFGSDFPVESPDPLLGLYAAVTLQDARGEPWGGWRPRERLSPEEALRAFTEEVAFASFSEERRGKLVLGMDADLTLLDTDPLLVLATDARKLLRSRVLATYISGVRSR